jgi:hypothetical protein
MTFDLVIENGLVVDGTGAPARRASEPGRSCSASLSGSRSGASVDRGKDG